MSATYSRLYAGHNNQPATTHGFIQRKCSCGGSAGLSGHCSECDKNKLSGVQTKLSVGEPDDVFEQEADQIARQIVDGSTGQFSGDSAPQQIRRFTTLPATASAAAPPASVATALSVSGQPLSRTLRKDMEQRFGHDFSQVRIHTDSAAERSAQDLGAHAYTLGHDLVFAQGRFAPETREGRRLLAHELTHVVQQAKSLNLLGGSPRHVQCGGKKEPTTTPNTCGGWTCAPAANCPNPDGKSAPSSAKSTAWSLTANLDLDVLQASDITGGDDVGHAFVEFTESNGDRYTYGHYHNKTRTPDLINTKVPGCTAHPDSTHSGCVDMKIKYNLAEADYKTALDFAKSWCIAGQPYDLFTNNCTTFVSQVVKQAGQSMPSPSGKVGPAGTMTADNPNTLFDAHVSQADNSTWRNRVSGDFTGQYDTGGTAISFKSFALKTDEKFSVGGEYSYTGSTGDTVEGTLDGRLVFNVDDASKAVAPVVPFDWKEPGGTGKGRWSVSSTGDLKGTWGRGGADSGAGGWELSKKP